jgi:hypothetical protein
MTETRGVTDNPSYLQACTAASHNSTAFATFRQHPIYVDALEHVSGEQGLEYLHLIVKDQDILNCIDKFKANDLFGKPITYNYQDIGHFSPVTLRYMKVLTDLKKYFHILDHFDICEIGVGYGGQCRIINAYFEPATYCLVDKYPALDLTRRYLDNYILNSVLEFKTMNELATLDYDLVISNYAFTELARDVQDVYLKKVILRSTRGYITYNQIIPAEFHSYNAEELMAMIPNSEMFAEEPLTAANNCIIVWGF